MAQAPLFAVLLSTLPS
jgi:hypothetical protein